MKIDSDKLIKSMAICGRSNGPYTTICTCVDVIVKLFDGDQAEIEKQKRLLFKETLISKDATKIAAAESYIRVFLPEYKEEFEKLKVLI